MSQNYFYQFVSEEAYSSSVLLCNAKCLPLLDAKRCYWNVNKFRDTLKYPVQLTLEELRGVALAVCGTEYETEDFARYLLQKVHKEFDTALVAACTNSNFLDVCLMGAYLAMGAARFDECVFALQFLQEGKDRQTILNKIDYNLDIDFMTEQPRIALWLLRDQDTDDKYQVELLNLLYKCYKTIPKLNAALYGKLSDYGIGRSKALQCIWALHKFEGNQQKAESRLAESLATSTAQWGESALNWIKKRGGKLDKRIIKQCNYKTYYEMFGFHFPELDFNENDFVALNTVRSVLSDADKCRLAYEKQLDRTSVMALGIEFSDWNPELLEYHNSLGLEQGTWQYFVKDKEYSELETEEERIVWATLVDDISDEEVLAVLPVCKTLSLYAFVSVVSKMNDRDKLSEEDEELYNELKWKWIRWDLDYTLDDYKTGKYKFREFPNLWAYKDVDISANSYGFDTIEKVLEQHNSVEALNAICSVNFSEQQLLKLSKQFDIIEICKQYGDSELPADDFLRQIGVIQEVAVVELDEETKNVLEYSSSFTISFREWTDLSFEQCLASVSFREIFKQRYLIQHYRNNARFNSCMGSVFNSWVINGTPMHALWDKYASWYCYDKNMINWWCDNVTKDLTKVKSCGDFSPFYGYLRGQEVFLTDIGMIVGEDFDNIDIPFPVWKCSDVGECVTFEFGGCMLADGIQVPWQIEPVFDRCQYEARLILCN